MPEQISNSKRIAKNTLYMYIRMGVIMLVQIYTARVVLNALGVEDYGIYNVVGAFIVAFTFISGPLGTATQRFLNFELGKKEKGDISSIFSMSLLIYLVLALILVVVIEITGLWFIYNKMQMPQDRIVATLWAFHTSVIALSLGLLKTPFESLVIAHEKMSFYAYLGIIEAVLKLVNAWSLLLITIDKLILYSINQLIIYVIVIVLITKYCYKNFPDVKVKFQKNKSLFKELMSFSGWSLFGSVASMTANQGLEILLNTFYGVVINAAMGIANQINVSVIQFVSNFQVAFRPQLVKYYAAGELESLRRLIFNTSKYSFLLLFAIVCPLCFNMQFVLDVWLGSPPQYTAEFCILMLAYALLETLSAPMWMTVQATGRIKRYQIIISLVIFLNIIFSYIFLKLGYSPIVVFEIKCFLDLFYLLVRLLFMRYMVSLSIKQFIKEVIIPISVITTVSIFILYIVANFMDNGWPKLIVSTIVFVMAFLPLCIFIALKKTERSNLLIYVNNLRNKGL